MFANRNACEFIDLYPDRTLFSFLPKYNKYRKRAEKNWDYCITYPKSKDSKKVSEVCGVPTGITENNGGASIKIIGAITWTISITILTIFIKLARAVSEQHVPNVLLQDKICVYMFSLLYSSGAFAKKTLKSSSLKYFSSP